MICQLEQTGELHLVAAYLKETPFKLNWADVTRTTESALRKVVLSTYRLIEQYIAQVFHTNYMQHNFLDRLNWNSNYNLRHFKWKINLTPNSMMEKKWRNWFLEWVYHWFEGEGWFYFSFYSDQDCSFVILKKPFQKYQSITFECQLLKRWFQDKASFADTEAIHPAFLQTVSAFCPNPQPKPSKQDESYS